MSLYQQYRPQTFADVTGQDAVVTTLEQAAAQRKLAHAFLFAGSRGIGKTSVARILAKELMVQGIDDDVLQKQIIKGVEDGSLVDLLEIDAASNRGIDDVRDLIEKIQYSPVVAAAKVYIIDEVHMLTKEAFNALLKTLEEPPEYAYFILATTELNKIPSTIQSRCQCFPFRAINEEDIIRRLQYIADQEKIVIDRDALRAIAHYAKGGLRDAISLLDQLRSLSNISLDDVDKRIGSTGNEYVEPIFVAIQDKNAAVIIETVRKVEEAGIAIDVFIHKLLEIVRAQLHENIAAKQSTQHLQHMLRVLLTAIRDVRIAPLPGLVLESALLQLMSPVDSSTPAAVTVPKQKTEAKKPTEQKEESIETTKKPETKPDTLEKHSDAIVEAKELSIESLRDSWDDIVNSTTPASAKMSLKNGRLLEVDGDTVTVSFSSSFHKDKVSAPDALHTIEDVMEKIFKRRLRLECVVGEGAPPTGIDDDAVNLADAAAEIF